MFKIIRRISSSFYTRPDRPWSDDATSNAPTIGRKRRMSDEDEDTPDDRTSRKRRGQVERQDASELGELGPKGKETDPEVKAVTKGVDEVELEDKREDGHVDGKETSEDETAATAGSTTGDVSTPEPTESNSDGPVPSEEAAATDEQALPTPSSEDFQPGKPAVIDVPGSDEPHVESEEPIPGLTLASRNGDATAVERKEVSTADTPNQDEPGKEDTPDAED